jgi:uridine monophosphate synthetase
MSSPELLGLVAKAYASLLERAALRGYSFDRIAGIPTAGLPLAAAVSLETGIPMIFPRMNAKSHGTGRFIEGAYSEGEQVLLLDDLITSGKSKLEAIEVLRQAGLKVDHLVVLLERGSQGRRDMSQAGVVLEAFAHVNEFFPLLESMDILSSAERKRMEEYANR